MDVVCKMLVLGPRNLFKSIEVLAQETDVIGPRGINKASWLLTAYGFIKSAMKEGILDVKLVDDPNG